MGKSLVIVESPAKAKTINKYLGNDYVVKSSVGHIRDLPTGTTSKSTPQERAKQAALTRKMSPEEKAEYKSKKSRQQLIARMGVDPENNWEAHYEVLPGKEKVVDELKRLAKNADTIYLATDLDREGEAIAWHLREAIGGDEARYKRVVFNEITKNAIKSAFDEPSDLDMNRVNAQQARRFLDRVVGFMVSPLLWSKVARGLSAGRVQSVAVRLIVEREKDIRAFNPEEFWELDALLATASKEQVKFETLKYLGKEYRPTSQIESDEHVARIQNSGFVVSNREDKPTRSKPSAPFITSTLQQAASTRLSFGVKKTMMLAQRLYEGGYITYMRTDSTNLSNEAVEALRDFVGEKYGEAYLPKEPIRYSSKEGAQEAHEAIRPSDVTVTQNMLQGMDNDAHRLYELIRNQFIACQMTPAEYTSTSITVTAGDYELKARGRILRFDGYTRVLTPVGKKAEDMILPDIQKGDTLGLNELLPEQHFTRPPARYSEASLVKELEKRGIGRPSTYASIISTIQDRGYVRVDNRRFYAEKMGDIVTERLVGSFSQLMNFSFTAQMEEQLDEIAQGEDDWIRTLDAFYADFSNTLTKAEHPEEGMLQNQPTPTDVECPKCGRPMQIRTAATGVFLSCSGYALPPKERCKATINLVSGDEAVAVDDDEGESKALINKKRCKICDSAMDSYLMDETRKLHVCGNNPSCSGYEVEKGAFKIKGYDGPVIECDKCSSEMQLKTGRFGKYFGCTNEECKNTRKLLKNGEAAPPKMDPVAMPDLACQKVEDHYVLRDGATGLFLAASQFPRKRETRAPLVSELIPYMDQIDPKYHFFSDAPVMDNEGRPTVIRYSRKTKEQYVMTEENGKPTGWKAFHQNGKWVVEEGKKKK
ncbi:type I DNA topoisomerase [Marinomonas mediterranea]|jgi:DNA topoisomerase I (EC 5.99.1.2)|uniref:DNA topoisomerase 1 n=1 Tax=Marinomonas mediterranea (strain ATCC 700492 / JCM 21426 / NBRC 103028 / MMB-1) TaxID=717774 RepID=F2JTI0_MARM1|nr:type I DNA topoisomerase [Marinomonas mediterranea]ADZ91494.1 DNA topoisomerase I [Marinomonas mediterranea MMB-1]WCN09461.1 type I DNA topoisomerase [Marinomonas mediterranea]WCN13537.1 type I DNA topoisomerase [Marinomonas mediterranea]WCN17603.1 type I DNA topoisomerase [Marinomonas mediterranea MMB-1]